MLGSETGEMTLSTGSLEYRDIEDYDYSESSGFGFDLSASYGENQQKKDMLSGTAGVSVKHEGQEKEQSTKATIGQGRIIIGGSEATEEQLEGLNRDVNASQEITKDMITGALDASLSVDLRMFTEEGREDIGEDFDKLGENLATAAAGVVDGTKNLGLAGLAVGETIVDGITGNLADDKGIIGTSKDKVNLMQATREYELQINAIKKNLEEKGIDPDSAQGKAVLDQARDETYKKYGVSDKDYKSTVYAIENDTYHAKDENGNLKYDSNGEPVLAYRQGGYVEGDNVGGVNLIGKDGNMIDDATYYTTSAHESMHGLGRSEEYAGNMGEFIGDMSGKLTIMGGGSFMGDAAGTSGSAWLSGGVNGGFTNGGYLVYGTGSNKYFTEHDGSTTQNLGTDEFGYYELPAKAQEIIDKDKALEAQNDVLAKAAIAAGATAAAVYIPGAAEVMLVGGTAATGYSLGGDINTILTADHFEGSFVKYDDNGNPQATSYGEMGFNIGGKVVILGANLWGASALTAAKGATNEGGLNLYKWGESQTGATTGWKNGDYMLHLPNQGSPKLNWKANYGALRREMNLNKPIYDSFRQPNGDLISTGGFLNAERSVLINRGWTYAPSKGAWLPPSK
ncbi:hypothetical protein Dip518_001570 [Parelusimicrobium proximum]|uniref:hypothetical protein n=1 Tax=Parelusimicrobium proximum TaxID=3228953 RepID=UPI003D183A62